VIETHERKGDFKEWSRFYGQPSAAEIAPKTKVRGRSTTKMKF